MDGQLALLICLVLIGVLGGLVGLLWFQLWLSRRDVNLMRRLQYVAPQPDPEESGGCLGGLLGPVAPACCSGCWCGRHLAVAG